MVSSSAMYALYQVSVRQATISLSLLLACTSRYKPWGSSTTTPLVVFHHRLTACPSYNKKRRLCTAGAEKFQNYIHTIHKADASVCNNVFCFLIKNMYSLGIDGKLHGITHIEIVTRLYS